jgi:hypothetical protein
VGPRRSVPALTLVASAKPLTPDNVSMYLTVIGPGLDSPPPADCCDQVIGQ